MILLEQPHPVSYPVRKAHCGALSTSTVNAKLPFTRYQRKCMCMSVNFIKIISCMCLCCCCLTFLGSFQSPPQLKKKHLHITASPATTCQWVGMPWAWVALANAGRCMNRCSANYHWMGEASTRCSIRDTSSDRQPWTRLQVKTLHKGQATAPVYIDYRIIRPGWLWVKRGCASYGYFRVSVASTVRVSHPHICILTIAGRVSAGCTGPAFTNNANSIASWNRTCLS